MSGDLSEDERVALAALDEQLDDPPCDTAGCENPTEFSIVAHGKGERHEPVSFRCKPCLYMFHDRNVKSLARTGAIRCPLCNVLFRDLGSWWEVRRIHV